MPRPLWNGSIGFGLVNVPVRLFRATSPKDVRFHQLHAKDGVRIKQKRFCPAEGEEVPYEEIVKGYEISTDRYVMLEPDELAALEPKSSKVIEIEDFVDLEEIDPIYYDSTYYVVPDERGDKTYTLLAMAMEKTNKVAIGRFVMRTKEYLCAVRVIDGALVLETMVHADEIVAVDDMRIPDREEVAPAKKEIEMAVQLVESLSAPFEPEKYKDDYRERVLEIIESKAQGNEIVVQPEAEDSNQVVDLMAALEKSLAKARASQDPNDQDADQDAEEQATGTTDVSARRKKRAGA